MPKGRKIIKGSTSAKKVTNRRAPRIGTRKAGVAAHSMSTVALQEVLSNEDKSRYHMKARSVLVSRGVTVE